jgi:hypothetical protein
VHLHTCYGQPTYFWQKPRPPFGSFETAVKVHDDAERKKVYHAQNKGQHGQFAVVTPSNGSHGTDKRPKCNVQCHNYLWDKNLVVVLYLAHLVHHQLVDI